MAIQTQADKVKDKKVGMLLNLARCQASRDRPISHPTHPPYIGGNDPQARLMLRQLLPVLPREDAQVHHQLRVHLHGDAGLGLLRLVQGRLQAAPRPHGADGDQRVRAGDAPPLPPPPTHSSSSTSTSTSPPPPPLCSGCSTRSRAGGSPSSRGGSRTRCSASSASARGCTRSRSSS